MAEHTDHLAILVHFDDSKAGACWTVKKQLPGSSLQTKLKSDFWRLLRVSRGQSRQPRHSGELSKGNA